MRKICLVCALALALAGAECSPFLQLAVANTKSELAGTKFPGIKTTDVSCENDIITYKYIFEKSRDASLKTIPEKKKEEFLSAMKGILVEVFCPSEGIKILFKEAKTVVMDYHLSSGELFGNINLTAKDCEK